MSAWQIVGAPVVEDPRLKTGSVKQYILSVTYP